MGGWPHPQVASARSANIGQEDAKDAIVYKSTDRLRLTELPPTVDVWVRLR